jgi:flagellum-specific peptidoglycan hydrolase FlgJ
VEPYGAFDARTWEIVNGQKKVMIAQFQSFPNLAEAFMAHALLLRAPHYRSAFAVRHDWKQFAERLGPKTSLLDSEHCGYSTNPSYSAELIKLVNLYRLNDPRAIQWYATGKDPGNRVIEPSDHLAIEQATGRSGAGPWKSSAASNQ